MKSLTFLFALFLSFTAQAQNCTEPRARDVAEKKVNEVATATKASFYELSSEVGGKNKHYVYRYELTDQKGKSGQKKVLHVDKQSCEIVEP